MNTFTFTPTQEEARLSVPYFEEARADFAPYYTVRNKTIRAAQDEIVREMMKLGGSVVVFREGFFGTGKNKRHGYVIQFQYNGAAGLIRVAGLPIKHKETATKIERIRLQALLNVRDWLKASVTGQIFSPGSEPLLQHLLVDGQRTVVDYIANTGGLPRLNPPPSTSELPELAGEIVR